MLTKRLYSATLRAGRVSPIDCLFEAIIVGEENGLEREGGMERERERDGQTEKGGF